MIRHIKLPFSKEAVSQIRCGDILYLTGTVYTARDAAHKRMYDAICAYKDAHKDDLFEERLTGEKLLGLLRILDILDHEIAETLVG